MFSTARTLSDGTIEAMDESMGLQYKLLTNTDHASISSAGVVSINSVSTPFSTYSQADVILVAAVANDQFGIGQIMIVDDDTDGDTLHDSYEDAVGLNKLEVTNLFGDNNGIAILDTAVDYAQVIFSRYRGTEER